jgi:hypothetical protein
MTERTKGKTMSKHEIRIRNNGENVKLSQSVTGYIVRIDYDGEETVVTRIKHYASEAIAKRVLTKKLAEIIG